MTKLVGAISHKKNMDEKKNQIENSNIQYNYKIIIILVLKQYEF